MGVQLMRNLTKQKAIIPIDGRPPIVFGRAGADDGTDIVPVSDEDVDTPNVFTALRDKKVEFVDETPDSEVLERVRQTEALMADRRADDSGGSVIVTEEGTSEASRALRPEKDRSIGGASCVGPHPNNPKLPCGAIIVRPAVVGGEEPPLCEAHRHLAPHYIATEVEGEPTEEFPLGKPATRWTLGRVDMRG